MEPFYSSFGITLETVRAKAEKYRRDEIQSTEIENPLSEGSKKVIRNANEERQKRGDGRILMRHRE